MIDTAEIEIKAGDGGDGAVMFRRLKYIPKGGPWGGDGGKGGDIIFLADPHINTLTPFRRKRHYHAEDGGDGGKNRQKGKDGAELLVRVPIGTIVYDAVTKEVIRDFTKAGQKETISSGGKGGLGNWNFKSSVNRTPKKATQGIKIKARKLFLELKLIADVGIIGLPSSGKSTLLNSLTRANAKTAAYHFTTLTPNLGVLNIGNFINGVRSDIVLADIPGLIEGASEGKGLGHDFLRHIERTRLLIHLVDGSSITKDLFNAYKAIQNELMKWNPELVKKPQIVAINKVDITEVKGKMASIKREFAKNGIDVIFISAASHIGLKDLVKRVYKMYLKMVTDKTAEVKVVKKIKTYTMENLPNRRIVFTGVDTLPKTL